MKITAIKLNQQNIGLVQIGDLIYIEFCEIFRDYRWNSGVYLITGIIREGFERVFSFDRSLYKRFAVDLPNPALDLFSLLPPSINGNSAYLLKSEED